MQIDKFFEDLYKPFHKNAEWFELKYLPTTSGILKQGLLCVGRRIPRKCWFKKTFKLNWTPCMRPTSSVFTFLTQTRVYILLRI